MSKNEMTKNVNAKEIECQKLNFKNNVNLNNIQKIKRSTAFLICMIAPPNRQL